MKSENTDAQVKAQIITLINNYRPRAEYLGFDYPTEPIENNSAIDLLIFLEEILEYIKSAELELEIYTTSKRIK